VWKKSKGNIIFWRDSNLTVRNPFLLPNKKAIQFLTFKGSFNFRVDRQVITEIIQLVSSCQFQIFDFVRKGSFIILVRGRSQTTLTIFCPFLTTLLTVLKEFQIGENLHTIDISRDTYICYLWTPPNSNAH
jgi:hypothetical protein